MDLNEQELPAHFAEVNHEREGEAQARRRQAKLFSIINVVVRVLILFFLDFLLNETLAIWLIQTFLRRNFGSSDNSNQLDTSNNSRHFWDSSLLGALTSASPDKRYQFSWETKHIDSIDIAELLLSPHRRKSALLWNQMSWTLYCISSVIYYYGLSLGIGLLLATTSQLFQFCRWLLPVTVLAVSMLWSTYLQEAYLSPRDSNWLFCPSHREMPASTFQAFLPAWISCAVLHVCLLIAQIVAARRCAQIYRHVRLNSWLCAGDAGVVRTRKCLESVLTPFCFTLPFLTPVLIYVAILALHHCNISPLNFNPFAVTVSCCLIYAPIVLLECAVAMRVLRLSVRNLNIALADALQTIRHIGLQHFVSDQWTRLDVPSVLQSFWLSRLVLHISFLAIMLFFPQEVPSDLILPNERFKERLQFEQTAIFGGSIFQQLCHCVDYIIARSVETIVGVVGMTSCISSIGHYVGLFFQAILEDRPDPDDDRNAGSLIGVLFVLLALQTGLTGLPVEKRLVKFYRNLWLLVTAMLHFIHHITNATLQQLSTTGQRRVALHCRALFVCVLLLTLPLVFLQHLWEKNQFVNPWLTSVTIFAIEVLVKVVVSLILYAAFLYDFASQNQWRHLDDFVFFVKATGACVELIFGVLLLGNGVWMLLVDSGGVIRSAMICIHAYFNIWQQSQIGWTKFKRRREAVLRLSLLQSPTEDELRAVEDVCSICYQDMTATDLVKVTQCRHFFHTLCLRKWLYIQENCPLCHKRVLPTQEQATTAAT